MLKVHNPSSIAPPFFPSYSNGIEVPANARWLYSAGIVGVQPDGKMAAGFDAQAHQIWRNLCEILESAQMEVTDIVKMVAYVVHGEDTRAYASIRGQYLGKHAPASTMITVPALLNPDMLIEVEIVAART